MGLRKLKAMSGRLFQFVRRLLVRVKRALTWQRLVGSAALLLCMFAVAATVVFVARPSATGSRQSASVATGQQPKRLVIFLDGTWNNVQSNTNVWRMRALCAPRDSDGKPQLVYYSIGVNGFLGGVFGQGIDENIRLAYEWLVENYNTGDEIFIFGFSRGAFTARSLAGLVTMHGILKPGSPIGIGELFERYRDKKDTIWKLADLRRANPLRDFSRQEEWLLKYSRPTTIKVVGVWDTVGSVGWKKGDIPGVSRSSFDYLQTGLRIHILNAYHALAIDEDREDFSPTLWTKRLPSDSREVIAKSRPISSAEQRWFVGAHANVGGGYPSDLLAQKPLIWMMRKAQTQGLSFRSEVELDGEYLREPIADSYGDFMFGAYRLLSFRVHRGIAQPPGLFEDGTHININETIDSSVFQRWRADRKYRPEALADWARRKRVDPARIETSVFANSPNLVAPE